MEYLNPAKVTASVHVVDDEPVCGDMATAILLRRILAELQKLNANLAKPKSKVETR